MQMQALLVTKTSVGWEEQWIHIYGRKIQYFTVKSVAGSGESWPH